MPSRPADQIKLSIAEKIQLLLLLATTLAKVCLSVLAAPFLPLDKRSRVYRRHVAYSVARHLFAQCDSKAEQALSADTDELYRRWAKKTNVNPEKETLADGTEAFWVGSKNAKTVLLYFHGGGYNLPASPGHIDFLGRLVKELDSSTEGGFAALLLQYDVAPFSPYPRQLAQAAALLNHVREKLRVAARNILIGGDSAGANICLSVLSHILHPHPDGTVPRIKMEKGERLKGALLIAPWTDPFGTEYQSLKRNEGKDVLTTAFLLRWSAAWLSGQPQDAYNRPIAAPAGWWNGVSDILSRFIVTVGADDVLFDSALDFAREFGKEWRDENDAAVAVAEDEGHVSCILDPAFGFKPEDVKMYAQVRDWVKKTLASG